VTTLQNDTLRGSPKTLNFSKRLSVPVLGMVEKTSGPIRPLQGISPQPKYVEKGRRMMKIAISSTGRDLDSPVDARFGRCLCFIVVDPATEDFEVLENTAAGNAGGAGVQAAQIVANAGVKAVLTGSLGPNATQVLTAAGVQMHTGVSGTVREALQRHQRGELQTAAEPASGPTAAAPGGGRPGAMAAGRGGGGGMGRGGGRGMGRGGGRRGGGGGFGAGPGGDCVCPACGERTPHRPGMPCFEARCPKCGAAMIRP
jgi:predicted Fe-Mo cluster-binding NifX family protein